MTLRGKVGEEQPTKPQGYCVCLEAWGYRLRGTDGPYGFLIAVSRETVRAGGCCDFADQPNVVSPAKQMKYMACMCEGSGTDPSLSHVLLSTGRSPDGLCTAKVA